MNRPPRRPYCEDKSGPRAEDAGPMAQEQGDVPMQDVPYGFCRCGCGEKTNIAARTYSKRGIYRGEPYFYIFGHHQRSSGVEVLENADGCWEWQRSTNGVGYGKLMVDGHFVLAHRHYYERLVGPIPEGLHLDHLCRNPPCCNPAHLEPVTHRENIRRGDAAKLTVGAARFIKASDESNRVLARRFGVSPTAVGAVRNGESWKDA